MILFDLNGTLTDPSAIGDAWNAPDLGVEVLAAAVQSAMVDTILSVSRPFSAHVECALRDRVRDRRLDPGPVDEALTIAGALPPVGDVAAGLDALAGAGHRLAVLTNSGAEAGRCTLETHGLAGRFERILGVDAVGSFKPHPATYRYALEELNRAAAEVTFVSAHAWDLAGAADAGMRTALLLRDERPRSAFPPPDVEVGDLRALAERLNPPGS
jgi:2-haloacid dehalogenase